MAQTLLNAKIAAKIADFTDVSVVIVKNTGSATIYARKFDAGTAEVSEGGFKAEGVVLAPGESVNFPGALDQEVWAYCNSTGYVDASPQVVDYGGAPNRDSGGIRGMYNIGALEPFWTKYRDGFSYSGSTYKNRISIIQVGNSLPGGFSATSAFMDSSFSTQLRLMQDAYNPYNISGGRGAIPLGRTISAYRSGAANAAGGIAGAYTNGLADGSGSAVLITPMSNKQLYIKAGASAQLNRVGFQMNGGLGRISELARLCLSSVELHYIRRALGGESGTICLDISTGSAPGASNGGVVNQDVPTTTNTMFSVNISGASGSTTATWQGLSGSPGSASSALTLSTVTNDASGATALQNHLQSITTTTPSLASQLTVTYSGTAGIFYVQFSGANVRSFDSGAGYAARAAQNLPTFAGQTGSIVVTDITQAASYTLRKRTSALTRTNNHFIQVGSGTLFGVTPGGVYPTYVVCYDGDEVYGITGGNFAQHSGLLTDLTGDSEAMDVIIGSLCSGPIVNRYDNSGALTTETDGMLYGGVVQCAFEVNEANPSGASPATTINDMVAGYATLLARCQAAFTQPVLFLKSYPMPPGSSDAWLRTADRVQDYSAATKAYALANNLPYFDLHEHLLGTDLQTIDSFAALGSMMSEDVIHLSHRGQRYDGQIMKDIYDRVA